jgi:DNA-binding beta-propeller fold protein YncE
VDRVHPTGGVLPDGRIVAPAGVSATAGSGTLGMALSPDGRYLVASNAGGPNAASSLTVIDARTLRTLSTYQEPGAQFFIGVAAARDPNDPGQTLVLASDAGSGSVRVLRLDESGGLSLERSIPLASADLVHPIPAQIAIAPGGREAYVSDNLDDAVVQIDVATRTIQRSMPCGDFPLYVAADADTIVVAGTGLSTYAILPSPATQPQFVAPAFDSTKSSALSVLALAGAGGVVDPVSVPMDRAPDGTVTIGGAAPGATVMSADGRLAYVALTNVDRIAIVSLSGTPRVVRGLDLRLYPGAPYGAQPSAEALSRDGKRLYVALAGLNAVAVLDAKRQTRYRYGLIPTGWYPSALALSADGRYLYVASAKGFDGAGILQRVDLKRTSLVRATLAALRYNRTPEVARFNPVIPPLRSNKRSVVIDHVVYIAVGTLGYDAMFGDLKDAAGAPRGNGDSSLDIYSESQTPNLHALARTYALADNFYASDADPNIAKEFALGPGATLYQQFVAASDAARGMQRDAGDDPEDYSRSGFIFNALQRAGLAYRDYGGLLRLSGFDGAFYHSEVPALAALSGNVDLDYAGENPKVSDEARADEFVRDMGQLVDADRMPSFTYVWIPPENGAGAEADADRALGQIVAFLSRTPHWSSTVIFVTPHDVQSSQDHVDALRSYALVVSPLAKPGYVGSHHLTTAGILKTEEEIFGLPPLGLDDLLTSDMAGFFSVAPAPQPYDAQ